MQVDVPNGGARIRGATLQKLFNMLTSNDVPSPTPCPGQSYFHVISTNIKLFLQVSSKYTQKIKSLAPASVGTLYPILNLVWNR